MTDFFKMTSRCVVIPARAHVMALMSQNTEGLLFSITELAIFA